MNFWGFAATHRGLEPLLPGKPLQNENRSLVGIRAVVVSRHATLTGERLVYACAHIRSHSSCAGCNRRGRVPTAGKWPLFFGTCRASCACPRRWELIASFVSLAHELVKEDLLEEIGLYVVGSKRRWPLQSSRGGHRTNRPFRPRNIGGRKPRGNADPSLSCPTALWPCSRCGWWT